MICFYRVVFGLHLSSIHYILLKFISHFIYIFLLTFYDLFSSVIIEYFSSAFIVSPCTVALLCNDCLPLAEPQTAIFNECRGFSFCEDTCHKQIYLIPPVWEDRNTCAKFWHTKNTILSTFIQM